MPSNKWTVNSAHTKEVFLKHVEKLYDEHKYVEFTVKTGKQRTSTQNAAMHKYLSMLAEALNEAGFEFVYSPCEGVFISIPWNKDSTKEYLWRPVQRAVIRKSSTKDADRNEYTIVYETLNRWTAEKFGISIPFPSREDR